MRAAAAPRFPIFLFLLMAITLLALAMMIMLPAMMDPPAQDTWLETAYALENAFAFQPVATVPDNVELGTHAADRHGEETVKMVRETVKNCQSSSLRELKGINEYTGYRLFACLLPKGKLAIWVLYEGVENFREVTAFVSRGSTYLKSLVDEARYVFETIR